ncbi:urea ABC transporter substrate-binding protein [Catenulispora yoronensis]|uniref:Urea ABC transporter substrate-binding protein n=1 Tax=Catenulispora yoronensis TaxID=450799 RepID=A0ABP5EXF6_9ACTN
MRIRIPRSQPGSRRPVRVGVLHSLTGPVAIAEKPIVDATLFAIDELNAAGGVLGRTVEPVVADGCSDWPTFAAEAERLIGEEGVAAIFGCYTSASRKTIIPVVERHDSVLFYPTFYEGIEDCEHVVYGGSTANQSILPAVAWFLDNRGKRFFLVGSDYVYPRSVNAIVKDALRALGGEVVAEVYLPLGQTDVAGTVAAINDLRPEVILNTLVGDTNVPFFAALRRSGVTPRSIPSLSFVVAECELACMDSERMAGDYIASNYFQSIATPENQRFVEAFRRRYGSDRVISDTMACAYSNVRMWAQAAQECRDTAAPAVRQAIRGQRYTSPEGPWYVDEENLHAWKRSRIGQIRADGQLDIVWTSDHLIRPMPYSPYRTRREWHEMLTGLYEGWGQSWACPVPPDTPEAVSWSRVEPAERGACGARVVAQRQGASGAPRVRRPKQQWRLHVRTRG